MKIKFFNKLGFALAVVLIVGVLATSCIRESSTEIIPQGKDEAMVTFALKLPSNATPTTRALTPAAEDKVNTIEIIAFKGGMYSYLTYPITAISGNKFTVKLVKGEFDLLVLANSRSAIDALPSLTGKTKQQVLDLLTVQITAVDKKWSADINSGTYRHIPMSSEVFTKDIKEDTDFSAGKDGAIKLYRMLSRVDVKVTGEAAGNFKLLEVGVFNYNLAGNIVPKFTAGIPLVNAPTQSREGANSYVKYELGAAALLYEGEIYLMEAANLATNGTTPLAQNDRTCLIVKGEYGGSAYYYRVDFSNGATFLNMVRNHQYVFNITKVSNIGFDSPQEAFLAGPVNMTVEVVAWNNGNMSDIQTNGRDNMGVSKSLFELSKEASANNTLTVFTDYHGSDLIVSYSTSATDATQTATWLTNPTKTNDGATSGLKTYTIGFDAQTNNGALRTGYIHLRAGSLYMVVRVEQSIVSDVSLKILLESSSSSGVFDQEVGIMQFIQDGANNAPTTQRYKIQWTPKSAEVALNIKSMGEGSDLITWSGSAPDINNIISDPSGEKIFTVQPTTFTEYVDNSFAERQSLLIAQMAIDGKTTLQTLIFNQIVKDVQIIHKSVYTLDGMGGTKHFATVKSNVDWKLMITQNLSSGVGGTYVPVVKNLKVGQSIIAASPEAGEESVYSGKHNLPLGENIYFIPINDRVNVPSIYLGTFGLAVSDMASIITDTANMLCSTGYPQDGKESNCYMVQTKTTDKYGLLIPVRNANGVITTSSGTPRMQDNWPVSMNAQIDNDTKKAYGAKLLWTDTAGANGKGLANDAAISIVIHASEGPDGYIFVLPGTTMGNGVVAITRTPGVGIDEGTGVVLWSFHIWVTSYANPNVSNVWMNRNLGAISNTTGIIGSHGNYYQWGRKDAFPKATGITQKLITPIYNASGTIPIRTPSLSNGMEFSVKSPMTLSHSSWNGSNTNLSWITVNDPATGQKTAYDPCPHGWRIPTYNASLAWNEALNTKSWGKETTKITGITWSPAKYGIDWIGGNYRGGYYPSQGYFAEMSINKNSIEINNNGTEGTYWSAGINPPNAYTFKFSALGIIPSGTTNINDYDALPVRCVAE